MWRIRLGTGPAVVKQVVGGADPDRRYAREVLALQTAAAAEPAVAPAVLGLDRVSRLLVLEHLGKAPAGADWPIAYARALAGLHATAHPAPPALPLWRGPTPADVAAFLRLARELDVGVPPRAAAELSQCVERASGWPADALLHGDPCPGNEARTSAGLRFVDFEQAALGPGLVELAYLRMAFPTCWCAVSIPEPQIVAAEAAYRAVSSHGDRPHSRGPHRRRVRRLAGPR